MRKDIIEASKLHFKAHIEKHRINVENLLEKGGVIEHPDIMDTIEKELEIILSMMIVGNYQKVFSIEE